MARTSLRAARAAVHTGLRGIARRFGPLGCPEPLDLANRSGVGRMHRVVKIPDLSQVEPDLRLHPKELLEAKRRIWGHVASQNDNGSPGASQRFQRPLDFQSFPKMLTPLMKSACDPEKRSDDGSSVIFCEASMRHSARNRPASAWCLWRQSYGEFEAVSHRAPEGQLIGQVENVIHVWCGARDLDNLNGRRSYYIMMIDHKFV